MPLLNYLPTCFAMYLPTCSDNLDHHDYQQQHMLRIGRSTLSECTSFDWLWDSGSYHIRSFVTCNDDTCTERIALQVALFTETGEPVTSTP